VSRKPDKGKPDEKGKGKAEKPQGIDPKLLSKDELIALINKKHGVKSTDGKTVVAPVLMQASSARALELDRIQTGIFGLDLVTGGGIPRQRITKMVGHKSSGKTTTAVKVAAACQSRCRVCNKRWRYGSLRSWLGVAVYHWEREGFPVPMSLWTDQKLPQHGYDHEYLRDETPEQVEALWKASGIEAKGLDVDAKRARLQALKFSQRATVFPCDPPEARACKCARPSPWQVVWLDVEVAFDADWFWVNGLNLDWVYAIRPDNAEVGIDTADAMLRSGQVDLVVVDSLAQLSPTDEVEGSVGDVQVGLQARLVNKAMRKWISALASTGMEEEVTVTILLINQWRMKVGVMFGSPQVEPAGLGHTFASSIDIDFRAKEVKKAEDGAGAVSVLLKFVGTKNRTAPEGAEGAYEMWVTDVAGRMKGEVDEVWPVVAAAKRLGYIVDRGDGAKGKRWYYPRTKLEDTSEDKLVAALVAQPVEFDRMRCDVLGRLLGRSRGS
jgi:RecA/RadA recombinase